MLGKNKNKDSQEDTLERMGAMKIPIGTVHLVNEAGRFVLVRSSRALKVEPGTVLEIVGPSGTIVARAQVSPARRGQFLTADILDGVPVAGSHVLMNYVPKQPENPSDPTAPRSDIQVLE